MKKKEKRKGRHRMFWGRIYRKVTQAAARRAAGSGLIEVAAEKKRILCEGERKVEEGKG